jgi:hypothetical protein
MTLFAFFLNHLSSNINNTKIISRGFISLKCRCWVVINSKLYFCSLAKYRLYFEFMAHLLRKNIRNWKTKSYIFFLFIYFIDAKYCEQIWDFLPLNPNTWVFNFKFNLAIFFNISIMYYVCLFWIVNIEIIL